MIEITIFDALGLAIEDVATQNMCTKGQLCNGI